MANNKFFKNTYITGEGRTNYLSVRNSRSYLEDPLFTSFTFDIDYITSPLFYTINDYSSKYADNKSLAKMIETALEDMYGKYMKGEDSGYDILPLYSAEMVDGYKLGFGLQQNVYVDLPLYGATEYIYMVDKRNGNDDQNDVRYDNNNGDKTQNVRNSYKLGDSVKSVVNESDKAWAENKAKASKEQVSKCEATVNDENVKLQHATNKTNLETAKNELENIKQSVDGVEGEFTEEALEQKVNELKSFDEKFEQLKKDIISWVNSELQKYQNKITDLYKTSNTCVKYILAYEKDVTKYEEFEKVLKEKFTSDYERLYLYGGNNTFLDTVLEYGNKLCTFSYETNGGAKDDRESLLLDTNSGDSMTGVRKEKIIEKFKKVLIELKLYDVDTNKLKFDVKVLYTKQLPDWAHKVHKNITWAVSQNNRKIADYGLNKAILNFMKFEVSEASFMNFDSDAITQSSNELGKYEKALDEIKTAKYGYENGAPCDKDNPSPDSKYAKMLEAQEALDNDEFSQASKMLDIAKSENAEMSKMLEEYDTSTASESIDSTVPSQNQQQSSNSNSKPASAPQTVLNMLGFIYGMKKMTNDYPYIIQGITGLDTAYNKHYGIKDPYLGSGEDKITLTCLESIDLRVSSMFNRYFNAVYDRQYRRERVPVNLRRFNCSVYVHDVRNFASRSSSIKNRITELSDMYYGVIEFKFYDCEIVPEETGNIFNDISNEAPSEMKKTNFTFTYGNCVVNFVPKDRIGRDGMDNYNRLSELAELDKIASLELDVSKAGFQLGNYNTSYMSKFSAVYNIPTIISNITKPKTIDDIE